MTFELVLSHLRKRDFAVLSTISKGDHRGESEYLAGRPFDETASVVSPATDHPVARSSLDWTDEEGTDVFRRFWIGRRILKAYLQLDIELAPAGRESSGATLVSGGTEMSARVILTYDDYAALPDDGRRYELNEGELIMMPLPRPRH